MRYPDLHRAKIIIIFFFVLILFREEAETWSMRDG